MDDMADMAAQSSKLTSSETAANEELALLRKDYAEASECAEDYALTRSDIRALKEESGIDKIRHKKRCHCLMVNETMHTFASIA